MKKKTVLLWRRLKFYATTCQAIQIKFNWHETIFRRSASHTYNNALDF